MSEHGHQIGFWRHDGHRRKCNLASQFNYDKAIRRGRALMESARLRRERVDLARRASFFIFFGSALVLGVYLWLR